MLIRVALKKVWTAFTGDFVVFTKKTVWQQGKTESQKKRARGTERKGEMTHRHAHSQSARQ